MSDRRPILESIPVVGGLLRLQLERQLNRHKPQIERWALGLVWEQMGLPDLTEGESITRESFTQALNRGPLAPLGIELTNVFDKAAVRRDFEQAALRMAAEEFGIRARTLTVEGVKEALRAYVAEKVAEQIEAGGGDLIDGARELAALVRIIKAVHGEIKDGGGAGGAAGQGPRPLKMDPASIANRERQARYRQRHKHAWVPHGWTREG